MAWHMLKSIYNWLVNADPPCDADLIFVLAGRQNRKAYSIDLFRKGRAPRILFSVGRFEIRRFAALDLPQTIDLLEIAKSIPPPQRHFFVQFTNDGFEVQRIPVRALGTLTEIDALSRWLESHPEISSLLVVSSETHLRRLRICCRWLLSRSVRIRLLAVPEDDLRLNTLSWWRDSQQWKLVLTEYVKIACYCVVLPLWRLIEQPVSKLD